jgi:hypothetical protein
MQSVDKSGENGSTAGARLGEDDQGQIAFDNHTMRPFRRPCGRFAYLFSGRGGRQDIAEEHTSKCRRDATAIVSAVIDMGRSLHQRGIAEGVEDEAQLAVLKNHNCDEGHGLLFSQPLNAVQLQAMLGDGKRG